MPFTGSQLSRSQSKYHFCHSNGALRVMINLNQLGEAAGVAAYLAVHRDLSVQQIPGEDVRKLLKAGGSAL